ncbi:hypothetical protein A2U01_0090071, partial [Trifolium medium]|nr:hypothetical protein [Trifolium medium]
MLELFFSPQKTLRKRDNPSSGTGRDSKRKKVGGVLRHTMQNLKKVARLP